MRQTLTSWHKVSLGRTEKLPPTPPPSQPAGQTLASCSIVQWVCQLTMNLCLNPVTQKPCSKMGKVLKDGRMTVLRTLKRLVRQTKSLWNQGKPHSFLPLFLLSPWDLHCMSSLPSWDPAYASRSQQSWPDNLLTDILLKELSTYD